MLIIRKILIFHLFETFKIYNTFVYSKDKEHKEEVKNEVQQESESENDNEDKKVEEEENDYEENGKTGLIDNYEN